MTRLLALRALGLGDLLTAVPALRGAALAWPQHELVLGAPADLGAFLVAAGVVDAVLPASGLQPLAWTGPPPAVALNLHGSGPQSHRLLQALRPGRLVGYANPAVPEHDGPAWTATEHEVDRWVRLVRAAGGCCDAADLLLPPNGARGGHVVVHPGAAAPSRRWPAGRWRQVAAALAADGHGVVVTGVAAEAGLCAAVAGGHPAVADLCDALPLPRLAEVVGTAALVLCGDTGVAHLATAYRTPSVLLFGPVSPALWGPRIDGDHHAVLWAQGDADQSSGRPGDPHGEDVDARLDRITVEDVLAAARRLLAGGTAGAAPLSRRGAAPSGR